LRIDSATLAGRRIGTEDVVVPSVWLNSVKATAIARMQLHAVIGRVRNHVCRAHAHRIGVLRARRDRRSKNRHVAAAVAGLFQETTGGVSAGSAPPPPTGCIDRNQCILQPVLRDIDVAIAMLRPMIRRIRYRGLQMRAPGRSAAALCSQPY